MELVHKIRIRRFRNCDLRWIQNLKDKTCQNGSVAQGVSSCLTSMRSWVRFVAEKKKVVSIREVAISERQFLKKDLSITKHNEKRWKLNPSVLVTFSHHLVQDPMVNLRKG